MYCALRSKQMTLFELAEIQSRICRIHSFCYCKSSILPARCPGASSSENNRGFKHAPLLTLRVMQAPQISKKNWPKMSLCSKTSSQKSASKQIARMVDHRRTKHTNLRSSFG